MDRITIKPATKNCRYKINCALAAKQNITTAFDNTFDTPILQKPLSIGVDHVMHSSTKFF